jgi:SAM-dependent methyltransferase
MNAGTELRWGMARDWVAWHKAYEDPASSLWQRQRDVATMIRTFLDNAPAGQLRVLSLCAGDGGDLELALAGHPRIGDVTGALVEFDPELAERAKAKQLAVGSRLEVRCADAGDPLNFAEYAPVSDADGPHLRFASNPIGWCFTRPASRIGAPVDLLMLVGIFGNISDDDIRITINAVPSLCKEGATVIWGRHRREPDLTPQIREWFDAVGCTSTGFVSPGVGSHSSASERVGRVSADPLPAKLFTFVDDLW